MLPAPVWMVDAARIHVRVGVAYGTDVRLVRDALLEVAAHDQRVLTTPAPHVFFRDFGESALEFGLAVWIDNPPMEWMIASDLRFAIEATFRRLHIQIPFPQRDLHLRSGGQELKAAEPAAFPRTAAD